MELVLGAENSQSGVMKQERKIILQLELEKQPLTVCQGLPFLGSGKCHLSGRKNDKLSSVNFLSALDVVLAFHCTRRRKIILKTVFLERNVTCSIGVHIGNIADLIPPAKWLGPLSIM